MTDMNRSIKPEKQGRGLWVMLRDINNKDIDIILNDAIKHLPPKTPYEIISTGKHDYGSEQYIGWFYEPCFLKDNKKSFINYNEKDWKLDIEKGRFIIARGVTE